MNKSNEQGFTLIELLIVLVVIAILASLAYPSYEVYMRKVRMDEAKASIMTSVRNMERYYANKRTFIDASEPMSTDFFTITFAPGSPKDDKYEIIAKPTNKNGSETNALYYNSIGILSRCNKDTMDQCEQY